MGYSREHTEQTRQRILDHAGRLFRRNGAGKVSVGKVMEAAGLTHGGFYAHFKSKDALFEAVVGEEFDFTLQLRKLASRDLRPQEKLLLAISEYLNPERNDRIAEACTLASLSAEVARASKESRRQFTQVLRQLLAEFEAHLPLEDREARASAILSTCVGAITLSRAVDDADHRRSILNSAVAMIKRDLNSGESHV